MDLYKAFGIRKRTVIEKPKGAPGLGIFPEDLEAREAAAKREQLETGREDEEANFAADTAVKLRQQGYKGDAFSEANQKEWGERLKESANQMVRATRGNPDVMLDETYQPKPTDKLSRRSLSDQSWRRRDMENRPEDRGAWAREKNPDGSWSKTNYTWRSTDDMVNEVLDRPKGTPTAGKPYSIKPTGFKPQPKIEQTGVKWKPNPMGGYDSDSSRYGGTDWTKDKRPEYGNINYGSSTEDI